MRRLAAERWIAFPVDAAHPEGAAARVDHVLGAAGVDLGDVLRIDSLTAQKRLVEAGFGLALLPARSIPDELHARTLVAVDVDDLDVAQTVALVTRRGSDPGPAGRRLRDELRRLLGQDAR